jgi:hypothetical protein
MAKLPQSLVLPTHVCIVSKSYIRSSVWQTSHFRIGTMACIETTQSSDSTIYVLPQNIQILQ